MRHVPSPMTARCRSHLLVSASACIESRAYDPLQGQASPYMFFRLAHRVSTQVSRLTEERQTITFCLLLLDQIFIFRTSLSSAFKAYLPEIIQQP